MSAADDLFNEMSATDSGGSVGASGADALLAEMGGESQEEPTIHQKINAALSNVPMFNEASEVTAGVYRSLADIVDFLGPDTVNAALQVMGSEKRVPRLSESPYLQGGFVEPGLKRDILSAAGETLPAAVAAGQGIRTLAKPAVTQIGGAITSGVRNLENLAVAPTLAKRVAQSAAATPLADVGYGMASAAGGEIGEIAGGDTGKLVGAVLAPVAASGGVSALRALANKGAEGFRALSQSVSQMSDDGASDLLAQAMAREGITADELASKIAELGPDAIPADVGSNFARILRLASTKVPRIQGMVELQMAGRQSGQSQRLAEALSDATGTPMMNVNDEIIRLNESLKGSIDDAYAAARVKGEEVLFPAPKVYPTGTGFAEAGKGPSAPSVVTPTKTRLEKLLDGVNMTGSAKAAADKELAMKRLSGEPVTKLDIIDANKRALDDQINAAYKAGEANKARMLVKLKNNILEEVDNLLPEYKRARSIFAGKAELESAADLGRQFLKLKPRDIDEAVAAMGESEKKFFKLGAKEAILDKIDTMNISSDAAKSIFKKNGSTEKLRPLFDSAEKFDAFNSALEREGTFTLTKRLVTGGSDTAPKLFDEAANRSALDRARALMGSPDELANEITGIVSGISKGKKDAAYTRSLEKAAEILTAANVPNARIMGALERKSAKELESLLKDATKQYQYKNKLISQPIISAESYLMENK